MNDKILEKIQDYGFKKFSKGNFLDWCYHNIKLVVNGEVKNFSLEGHKPLEELYQIEEHPNLVIRKAAQVGVSTLNILRTLFLSDKYNLKVGYYFPSDEDIEDFVQGKVNPIIEYSEYLSNLMRKSNTDNISIKRIGKSVIYFRGVWSKRKVKSIDLDYIVKDEVDEANQENLKFAEDRLLHSKYGWISELSQPSVENYGIDKAFKEGDQRYWAIKCECGYWNFLDKEFPNCIITRGSSVYKGCVKCSKKLDIERGEWVASFPEKSKYKRSYHISQLIFDNISALKIKEKYEKATTTIEKKNFYISVLGVPYSTPYTKPINYIIIKECEGDHGFLTEYKFSFFGMDVGDRCHLVFGHPKENRILIHYLAELPADNEKAIIELIKKQNVFCGVIDAMPYKTLAKNIARVFEGRIYINYYKGDTLKTGYEGEDKFRVPKITLNRDESLDELVDWILDKKFIFPNPKKLHFNELQLYEMFSNHLQMLIKDPEDKNGFIEYHYKKDVPNHFAMALNYLKIASTLSSIQMISNVEPVFIKL